MNERVWPAVDSESRSQQPSAEVVSRYDEGNEKCPTAARTTMGRDRLDWSRS